MSVIMVSISYVIIFFRYCSNETGKEAKATKRRPDDQKSHSCVSRELGLLLWQVIHGVVE